MNSNTIDIFCFICIVLSFAAFTFGSLINYSIFFIASSIFNNRGIAFYHNNLLKVLRLMNPLKTLVKYRRGLFMICHPKQ